MSLLDQVLIRLDRHSEKRYSSDLCPEAGGRRVRLAEAGFCFCAGHSGECADVQGGDCGRRVCRVSSECAVGYGRGGDG